MRSFSYKLGRVEGIDLFLHPTFFLLLIYILAFDGGLPAVLLTAAVFFCVLLHELGHALAARGYGIATRDITLYPIGGVASLERMPRSAGPELLIALAGPAVNFVIAGGLFLGLELAGGAAGNIVGRFLTQLLQINLGLALFNLLPVFPMDGGRVFRALLSGRFGRLRATEIAVHVGQTIAVAAGAFFLVTGQWLGVVMALFIHGVGGAELRSAAAEEYERSGGFTPPPAGHRWVPSGKGVWILAPLRVHSDPRGHRRWS